MADLAKVGDPVSCPLCGITCIANGSADTFVDYQPVALVGVSRTACPCASVVISGLSWFYINDCHAAVHGSMTASCGTVLAASTVKTGSPSSVASARAASISSPNRVASEGWHYEYRYDPQQPHLKGGMTFISEPQTACVFAKSCNAPKDTTQPGTTAEPVSNFGQVALLGPQAQPKDSAGATAAGMTLARVAGSSFAEGLGTWSIRSAATLGAGASATGAGTTSGAVAAGAGAFALSALATLVLVLTPRTMGDGTLYGERDNSTLANLPEAATRVRFQFRRNAEGIVRVYGIHTTAQGGEDHVPTTKADWNVDKSAMVATHGGITITWTPNNGPVVNAPTTYPGTPETLDNVFVHPIAEGQDSVTAYPGQDLDDITWQDLIITFPADSGVEPLYLVFAKPAINPLEVGVYKDLSSRSRKDGLDIDHIPSQRVLEATLQSAFPDMARKEIDHYLQQAPSIAIPARIHQKYSETYGGRNTKVKQAQDMTNLQTATDSNFEAIKRGLLEDGFAEADIETAREQLHKLNQEQGWY